MAIRFNFTGRKKIAREHASFAIREGGDGLYFDASVSLGSYNLDPKALVFVEAYRQTSWMRFDFARVGIPNTPPIQHRRLTLFDVPQGILFRLKITSDGEQGAKLLAERDRIRPQQPGEEETHSPPLMDWKPHDLGEELWRVDFSDDPLLLINKRLAGSGYEQVLADPQFKAQVAPAIMRQILTRFLIIEEDAGGDSEEDARSRWMDFARELPGVGDEPELSDQNLVEDWIDRAVESFCRSRGLLERFLIANQGGKNNDA